MALESIFRLQLLFSLVDGVSTPLNKMKNSFNETRKSANNFSEKLIGLAKAGTILVSFGKSLTSIFLEPIRDIFTTKKALGELSSLGIENLKSLEDAAKSFSSTWAGTTKADFLSAAYDIKSGIASLSDEGVGEYTNIAGMTAKATKATIQEMTSLFAQGYGIYKGFYANLTDIEFAELFSSGISKSVQKFKTTGSQMASAIQNLGASATNSNVPLEEQFTILGMLQATMDGARAGTQYTSFLKNAARAGNELGLNFLDANKQLISMPQILTLLKKKFGETIDATEKLELTKAFGDQEAVKLIDLLYNKTDELSGSIVDMYSSLSGGLSTTKEMAEAINKTEPDKYALLQQKMQILSETIGNSLMPAANSFLDVSIKIMDKINEFAEKNPQILSSIVMLVIGIGGLITILGIVALSISVLGFAWIGLKKAMDLVSLSIKFVSTGINFLLQGMLKLNTVLQTTAFTLFGIKISFIWLILIIITVIGVVYSLWKNWDEVCAWCSNAWNGFISVISTGVEWAKGLFNGFVEFIASIPSKFMEFGASIVNNMVAGIQSVASAPFDALLGIFDNVRKLLPFSDAKEGPFSDLTLSGRRVITTFTQGIDEEANRPKESITNSFRKVKRVNLAQLTNQSDKENASALSKKEKERVFQNVYVYPKFEDMEDIKKFKALLFEIEEEAVQGKSNLELEVA